MAILYVSPKGIAWRKHSYSAGNDFDRSPSRYYQRRVLGWKEKDTRAAFKFGRALEEAIEYFHNNNGRSGVGDFIDRWGAHKDDKEMKYTKTEKDWENLNRCGIDMMKLYEILQPSLPIPLGAQTVFQREYSKEVFPGDPNYGEIEMAGKLDIISYVEPAHPMLPKISWKPEYGPLRPVIVDIKTGAKDFHERQGRAAQDKQLKTYAWLTGIRDTAFLWFKKTGRSLSKGTSVTLLVDAGPFKAGEEAVIAQVVKEGVWVLRNDYFMGEMDKAQGRKKDGALEQTNAAKERKSIWLVQNASLIPEDAVTRQRVQFNAGRVTDNDIEDAAYIAGRQIREISSLWASKIPRWPNTFGVKFPSDDTNDPYFRAFVDNDLVYREENFTKSEEENFDDDLFTEHSEEEEL